MTRLTTILTFLLTPTILFAQGVADDQYMDAFIVIADTSHDYYELRDKMFDLSEKLELEIDTMGRSYDKDKQIICLPEDHKDELYAGSYFPRRYPSETLSLESLNLYTEGKEPIGGTIALVVAITDDKSNADSILARVKQYIDQAYIIQTRMYMGCMH